MTPRPPSGSDEPTELAGYVDHELTADIRNQLERRLECDPALVEELHNQQQFSPANTSLWEAISPPEPSEELWQKVEDHITTQLNPSRNTRSHVRPLLAASIIILAAMTAYGLKQPLAKQDLPTAAFSNESLPAEMERNNERIEIAELPLTDRLDLAGPDEVTILEPTDQDKLTAIPLSPSPGDAPMLYTPVVGSP
jgi:hypothetical protein